MNIAVQSLAGAPALPPIALPADADDEPIIRLIKAYRAAVQVYNASDDDSAEYAEATYSPTFRILSNSPPVIQTSAGAIAAMRHVIDEADDELEAYGVRVIIHRVLEFLESAAGAELVHPDAELLALDVRLGAINADRDAIDQELSKSNDEDERLRADRTGLEVKPGERETFCRYFDHGTTRTYNPNKILEAKLYDPAEYDWFTLRRVERLNARLTELKAAAEAWLKAIDEHHVAAGRAALVERDDLLDAENWQIQEKMVGIRAATSSGLAVKARIIRSEWTHLWTASSSDLFMVDQVARSLVDDLLALQGLAQ